MGDDLVERLTRLCRDVARQAQAAGVQLGAPSRDDLVLLRAVLNGDPIRTTVEGPAPVGDLADLPPGTTVEFYGHPMVVVSADAGVVELIAPDKGEPTDDR